MKNNVILSALGAILLIIGVLVFVTYTAKRNTRVDDQAGVSEYIDASELASITAQFVTGKDGGYFSYLGSDREIQKVATGMPVEFGFFFRYQKPIDPKLVHFIASGTNGEYEIPVVPKPSESGWGWDYLATYTPKKKGRDVISISIDGTNEKATMEINSFDRELIWRDTDLIKRDFLLSEVEDFKWDWKRTQNDIAVRDHAKVDPEIPEFPSPGSTMQPGYLVFKTETERTRGKGNIRIFTLPPAEEYRNEETLPWFYEAVNILYVDIARKQVNKEDGRFMLQSPLGVGSTGLSHEKYIEGKDFCGFRFLSVGQYQSADPALQPTYTYIGLSNDGKYFIRFEHQLFSERLRSFLKSEPRCYSEKCINHSFDIVESGSDFDPNLEILDDLARSFEIRN